MAHDYSRVRHAYDEVAADYAATIPDTRAEARIDLAMVEAFVGSVLESVGDGDEARVLDAGCGAGRMSRFLADRGLRVEGIDLSPGMVAMARRDHPDLTFGVASLAALPYPDGHFAGVLLWYSGIHTPPEQQSVIYAEAARVLRPGGSLLVGFQSGEGTVDVAPAYRKYGHEVELHRYLMTADRTSALLAEVGLAEVTRLVRRPQHHERSEQAILLARAQG